MAEQADQSLAEIDHQLVRCTPVHVCDAVDRVKQSEGLGDGDDFTSHNDVSFRRPAVRRVCLLDAVLHNPVLDVAEAVPQAEPTVRRPRVRGTGRWFVLDLR